MEEITSCISVMLTVYFKYVNKSYEKKENIMQFQSNAEFVPYIFTKDSPIIEWGGNLYSPPVDKRRLHYHNCLEIGYCYEGSGVFLSEKEIIPFSQGDVSIIFPGQRHIACSNQEDISKWHFIMIDHRRMGIMQALKGDLVMDEKFWAQAQFPPVQHENQYPELVTLIRLITEEYLNKKSGFQPICLNLVEALFHMIYRVERYELTGDSKIGDELVEALHYISNHLHEKISIHTLADICNMSDSTFRRKFQASLGKAPLEFIQENRIKLAERLLHTDGGTVLEISQRAGFENMSSFLRQFKKYRGCSPTKIRKQKENENQIDTTISNC